MTPPKQTTPPIGFFRGESITLLVSCVCCEPLTFCSALTFSFKWEDPFLGVGKGDTGTSDF